MKKVLKGLRNVKPQEEFVERLIVALDRYQQDSSVGSIVPIGGTEDFIAITDCEVVFYHDGTKEGSVWMDEFLSFIMHDFTAHKELTQKAAWAYWAMPCEFFDCDNMVGAREAARVLL